MRHIVKRSKAKDFPNTPEELLKYVRYQPWPKLQDLKGLAKGDFVYWCDNKEPKTIRWRSVIAKVCTIYFKNAAELEAKLQDEFGPLNEEEIHNARAVNLKDRVAVAFRVQDVVSANAPKPIGVNFNGVGWLHEKIIKIDGPSIITDWLNYADNSISEQAIDPGDRALSELDAVTSKWGADDYLDGIDTRNRILLAIAERKGHRVFRDELLSAYEGRCAITGCTAKYVLEAAHICPHLGERSNKVRNGLLLRADIHTLFDLHLIRINPMTLKIDVHSYLKKEPIYEALHGAKLNVPRDPECHPSPDALNAKWQDRHCDRP